VAEGDLERGRAAYDDRRWAECVAALRAADEAGELQDRDIKALAISLYLVGDDAGWDEVMERGHQVALDRGDWRLAAQVSFWHGFTLFGRGEHARAGAWLSRTRELVGEHHLGGVEASLPDVVEARGLLVGRELRDPNLEVLGRLTGGQVLLQQAARPRPCRASTRSCSPSPVPFRGQCLVHRSQLKAMEGDWPAALDEARRATVRLGDTASGNAWCQLGEVHRLRDAWPEAEDAYRRPGPAGPLLHGAAVPARVLLHALRRGRPRRAVHRAPHPRADACADLTRPARPRPAASGLWIAW
jgi:hypothetical protein